MEQMEKSKENFTFITPTELEDLIEAGYDVEDACLGSKLKVVEPLISDDENALKEVELGNNGGDDLEALDVEVEKKQSEIEQEVIDDGGDDIVGENDWTRHVVHSDDDSDGADMKKNTYSMKVWDNIEDLCNVELGLHSRFKNAKVFQVVLKYYAAEKRFDYDYTKIEPEQGGVVCKEDDCPFYIWCHRLQNSTNMEIYTFISDHICSRVVDNKRITSDFLALRYLNYIRDNPNSDIPSLERKVEQDFFE